MGQHHSLLTRTEDLVVLVAVLAEESEAWALLIRTSRTINRTVKVLKVVLGLQEAEFVEVVLALLLDRADQTSSYPLLRIK